MFDFSETGFDELLDERGGKRFVDGELNGAFRQGVGLQFLLELMNNGGSGE